MHIKRTRTIGLVSPFSSCAVWLVCFASNPYAGSRYSIYTRTIGKDVKHPFLGSLLFFRISLILNSLYSSCAVWLVCFASNPYAGSRPIKQKKSKVLDASIQTLLFFHFALLSGIALVFDSLEGIVAGFSSTYFHYIFYIIDKDLTITNVTSVKYLSSCIDYFHGWNLRDYHVYLNLRQ